MDNTVAQPLVLLAEDEAPISDLVREGLQDAGYEVVTASSGAEAIKALETDRDFIALISDINLGGPPAGWDVAVRARELRPAIAVVYMTGDSAHEWSAHGVPQSIIVSKPFAPSQIAVAVATLLNKADGSAAV